MIEKLEIKKVPVPNNPTLAKNVGMDNESLFDKINELVDVVNELQLSIKPILEERESGIKVYEEAQDMYDKAQADPYAEQRKWIGSLVEYKLGDLFLYGILTDIKDGYTLPFVIDGASYTDNCWLPDESVIYHKTKGGDNE